MAINAPCTSDTWRKDHRSNAPSSSRSARTKTTSPSDKRSEARLAFGPRLPSAFCLLAQATSREGIQCPSSSSSTPSIPIWADFLPSRRTTAGYHCPSSFIPRGTSISLSAARHCSSLVSRSGSIERPVPRQMPCARS